MEDYYESEYEVVIAQMERDAWRDFQERESSCKACSGHGYFSTGSVWPFDVSNCRKCEGTGVVQ